jgi:hypothetical protein
MALITARHLDWGPLRFTRGLSWKIVATNHTAFGAGFRKS